MSQMNGQGAPDAGFRADSIHPPPLLHAEMTLNRTPHPRDLPGIDRCTAAPAMPAGNSPRVEHP